MKSPLITALVSTILLFATAAQAGDRRVPRAQRPGVAPIVYSSLEPEGLLVEQDSERLDLEEGAHRRAMISDPDCPLVLFFSRSYGGEAASGQMQEVPEKCRRNYEEWKHSVVHTQQEPLIPPTAKTEIDKSEDYDDTSNGRVRIDADGLAWYYEKEPAHNASEAITYVVVESRGEHYEIRDLDEAPQTVKVPARWKTSLLPQYSNVRALHRYQNAIGRSLASEVPVVEAPNADAPAMPFDPDKYAPKPAGEK